MIHHHSFISATQKLGMSSLPFLANNYQLPRLVLTSPPPPSSLVIINEGSNVYTRLHRSGFTDRPDERSTFKYMNHENYIEESLRRSVPPFDKSKLPWLEKVNAKGASYSIPGAGFKVEMSAETYVCPEHNMLFNWDVMIFDHASYYHGVCVYCNKERSCMGRLNPGLRKTFLCSHKGISSRGVWLPQWIERKRKRGKARTTTEKRPY